MRKIIAGKRYDTSTAVEVGEWDAPADGLDWETVTLHRKRSGEYFLHGRGGARTEWARMDGGLWCGGEGIRPLAYEGARLWAEEHLDADEYEAAFGEAPEDDGTVTITVRIPAATKAALEREQSRTGKTTQAIVCELLAALQ